MDIQQEIQVLRQRIHRCDCNMCDWNRVAKEELYDLILRALENIDLRIKQLEQGDGPY